MLGRATQTQSKEGLGERVCQAAFIRRFCRFLRAWHPIAFEAATPKSPCPGKAISLRQAPDARRPDLKISSKREEVRLFRRQVGSDRGCDGA